MPLKAVMASPEATVAFPMAVVASPKAMVGVVSCFLLVTQLSGRRSRNLYGTRTYIAFYNG